MIRQQVASTATTSLPITRTPLDFGVPWIGPLPSIPTMPSTRGKLRGKTREHPVEVGDGAVDTDQVNLVFGPAVNCAGDHAKEVLHGERRSRPVMGLHF